MKKLSSQTTRYFNYSVMLSFSQAKRTTINADCRELHIRIYYTFHHSKC